MEDISIVVIHSTDSSNGISGFYITFLIWSEIRNYDMGPPFMPITYKCKRHIIWKTILIIFLN
jgi:hypothetical protein